MSKSKFFTGQPIFSQLLSYLPQSQIAALAGSLAADKYCKRFTTYAHLVTQLYAVFNRCTSLREVTTGLLAWEHRVRHLGISHHPRRSTISDANNRRNAEVFQSIYQFLYHRYRSVLPDSRGSRQASRLFIADSTTIKLFQEVLRGSGLSPANGKRKGGLKVHTLMRSDEDVPCLIRFTPGASNDSPFLRHIHLPKGSFLVFDRGYNNYDELNRFQKEGVTWVTRLNIRTVYTVEHNNPISEAQKEKGVLEDMSVILGHQHSKKNPRVNARLIKYLDQTSGTVYYFLTNSTKLAGATVAALYRKRWQIEILFKRIKQTYPLRSFLGESENAIKVQIWCALIADLLLKLIKSKAGKKWSFANLAAMVRLHLMTYIDLPQFLQDPEKAMRLKPPQDTGQLLLIT